MLVKVAPTPTPAPVLSALSHVSVPNTTSRNDVIPTTELTRDNLGKRPRMCNVYLTHVVKRARYAVSESVAAEN